MPSFMLVSGRRAAFRFALTRWELLQIGPSDTPTAHRQIFFPRRARVKDRIFLSERVSNDVQESVLRCTSKYQDQGVVPPACKRLHCTVVR
jgi:hypothetical protein